MSNSANAIRRYVREVRKSPALAVGSALEELERTADNDSEGHFVAPAIPVADTTWQLRVTLQAALEDANQDSIQLPYPVTILGWRYTLLLVDPTAGLIVPPAEAIDVQITTNTHDQWTATQEQAVQKPSTVNFANLPLINDDRRLVNLRLENDRPILGVSFRWNVPLATVAAFGWGDVQITLGYFVEKIT